MGGATSKILSKPGLLKGRWVMFFFFTVICYLLNEKAKAVWILRLCFLFPVLLPFFWSINWFACSFLSAFEYLMIEAFRTMNTNAGVNVKLCAWLLLLPFPCFHYVKCIYLFLPSLPSSCPLSRSLSLFCFPLPVPYSLSMPCEWESLEESRCLSLPLSLSTCLCSNAPTLLCG